MWVITKDLLDGHDVGIASKDYKKGIELPLDFKMYDDDNILYYEGKMSGAMFDADFFAPLDWAMPHAGCTQIAYKNRDTGNYETF